MNDLNKISVRFFQPRPSTPIFADPIERGVILPGFVSARYSQLTYTPNGLLAERLRKRFSERLNKFHDSRGWNDQNARVGNIGQPVDDEWRNTVDSEN